MGESTVLSLDPKKIASANDLPGDYVRKGTDLEIPDWTFIFDGEANHATKQRGWTWQLGVAIPGVTEPYIVWIVSDVAKQKAKIKAEGATHLIFGSGDNANLARMARWIAEGPDLPERLRRIQILSGQNVVHLMPC